MSYLDFLIHYAPRLLTGLIVTVEQFAFAALLGMIIAVAFGLLRLSSNGVLRAIAIGYIEFFRGTSLLIQLFWIFFVLPLFGVTIDSFTAGVLSLALNVGAYGAELVRGAIEAVPRGQYEASIALNMPRSKQYRRIILPQAFFIMLPGWGNLLIELLKGTALVSLIAVPDLMFEVKQINAATYQAAASFGTALVIYYLLARVLLTPAVRHIERSMESRLGRR